MEKFHELRVKTINRETAEAVSVGFEVPDDLKDKFKFVAGQYLTLEKEIAGKTFRRSYSICSSPESEVLKVAVKQVADGLFSSWVNRKLKVGDMMNVFLPEGRFVFKPSDDENTKGYAAFAAGSGITPIMSILQNALKTEEHSKFVLVYGNKTPEQTIFYKDLLRLKEQYPDRFHVEFVFSKLETEEALFGHIDQETVDYILKDKFKEEGFTEFYICGPEPMMDTVSEVLKRHQINDKYIHRELFTADEKKETVKEQADGKTTVTVILDEEEVTFTMDRRERVLDAIINEGMDPPYSCQGGICSSCLAQVLEGHVEMVNNQILTEEEIQDGYVLTCQSHPTTPTLKIDYDDI